MKSCLNKLYLKNLVYCNLETICAVPPHGLTVHQVSTQSDETLGGVVQKGSAKRQADTGGYTIILCTIKILFYSI